MASSGGGFTMVDFSIPARDNPVSHPAADAPLCRDCEKMNLLFFDPTCGGCQDILLDPKTSIPQLFAVMRQWVPQTQSNMKMLTREVLRRGAHVNDKDSLTDLALLHYACKSGAAGVGNAVASTDLVCDLLAKGADTKMKCRWTDMNVLHYASFFDCSSLVETLVEADKGLVNATSKHFDGGTSLHIAAANLSLQAARTLVSLGADPLAKNAKGKTPRECVPTAVVNDNMKSVVAELNQLLEEAEQVSLERQRDMEAKADKEPVAMESRAAEAATISREHVRSPPHSDASSSGSRGGESVSLASLGIAIGDRVVIGADSSKQPKSGVLRFYGTTEFANGTFAGVELDEAMGKNDGSIGGIRYFTCPAKHGIFAPINKISKANITNSPAVVRKSARQISEAQKDSSSTLERNKTTLTDIQVGERVVVNGQVGIVRFTGVTKFAPGLYVGVELDHPQGKNDGSVDGTRYFTCKPNHGLFTPSSKVKRLFRRLDSITPLSSVSSAHDGSPDHSPTVSLSDTPSSVKTSSLRRSGSLRREKKSNPSMSRGSTSWSKPESTSSPANSLPSIKEGITVYYNSEVAVIRYIGNFDLSDGIWLGLELKRPCGKNDGSVQGKRYFTCKSNHGVMVRPSKVTYRGINCSKLLPTTDT